MTQKIKILIIVDENTTIYTDHVEKVIRAKGYEVAKISAEELSTNYSRTALAPSFFIVKNNKAAYMLPGKREINKIIKWIEDSNLI